ncbi:hypothetical protein [Methylocapsa acidiphila]|uniref:hypothetical protein n=1 Tax=Methylocapsa acidiphila TaxID=133552 RepID=UPI00041F87B8|nr:hypothetical protein [Methylocapsa acidiphila]
MTTKPLLLLALAIAALFASPARAFETATVVRDHCSIRIGPYLLNYSGFQPEVQSKEAFCADLPASGRTLIVLDVEQNSGGMGLASDHYNELRDMQIDFRIVRNVGQDEEDPEEQTEVYLPPEKYPAGTLTLQHDFKNGSYIGVVTARDYHGRIFVSRFPFRVGPSASALPYAVGSFVLGAAAVGFLIARRRSPALSRAVQRFRATTTIS